MAKGGGYVIPPGIVGNPANRREVDLHSNLGAAQNMHNLQYQNMSALSNSGAIIPGGINIKSGLPLRQARERVRCENCGAPTFNGHICTYCGA